MILVGEWASFLGKVSTEEEFESALDFVASGSFFWAKVSLIEEFESALNFVASGSVIGQKFLQ